MKLSRLLVFAVCVVIMCSDRTKSLDCDCITLTNEVKLLTAQVDFLVGQGPRIKQNFHNLERHVRGLFNLHDDVTALKSQVDKLQKLIDTSGMFQDESEGVSEDLRKNVTDMMLTVEEGEVMLKNLSKELADFQEEKETMKHDLEREKRLRRSLEEDISNLKEELNETKTLKEAVDSLQKDVEDLSAPTRNLSAYVDDLLSEREDVKRELAKEKEIRINLEKKIELIEKEVNETEELKLHVEGMKNKLEELEANITNENLDEIIEVKFAHLSDITNQTALKERLDILEYKFEVQQDAILGDSAVNSSLNISLNNRVERLEKMALSERNDTEELLELLRDQIISGNNSVVNEINNTVNTVMNESKQLSERMNDLQYDVRCINTSLLTKQQDVEYVLFTTESNHSLLSTDVTVLKETLQKLNSSLQEQILLTEKQNISLLGLSDEVSESYANHTSEIDKTLMEWKQEMNETTMELMLDLSNKTNRIIEELINARTKEDLEIKEKLDSFDVIIQNLEGDLKINFSLVNSKLKDINQEMAKNNKLLAKIHKIEAAVNNSASRDDLKHLTEQLVPISINISRLNGQMEDTQRQYISLDTRITEVKNWAVQYIDNERKSLEKQLRNLEEKIQRDINSTTNSQVSSARKELEAMIKKQEEIISRLVNESFRDDNTMITQTSCPHFTDIDPNVIITYKQNSYIPNRSNISDGDELIFRCIHIGRYLLKGHAKIRCENGKWTGSVPTCIKLPDEKNIDNASLATFTCPQDTGKYRYSLDCSKYYECKTGTKRILSCSGKMKFDPVTETCVHPEFSDCVDIPAIDFHPPIGLSDNPIAFSSTGTLVVYPGVALTLDCISRVDEDVEWQVLTGDVLKNYGSFPFGDKRIRMKVDSVTENNSGDYFCVKNKEKNNTIRVSVRAIECPVIEVEPPLILNPSNKSKMTLSSRLHFSCENNYSLSGVSLLTCLPTGKWSKEVPTCIPNGCIRPDTTDDPWIKLTPDLGIYQPSSKIKLSCSSGAPAKSIPTTVRCGEDGKWKVWNSSNFPTCSG